MMKKMMIAAALLVGGCLTAEPDPNMENPTEDPNNPTDPTKDPEVALCDKGVTYSGLGGVTLGTDRPETQCRAP